MTAATENLVMPEFSMATTPELVNMLSCIGTILDQVVEGLYLSYSRDGPMFIQDEVVNFPPRRTFDEQQTLLEILFPKYFNHFTLTLPNNTTPLKHKLIHLAWIMHAGIRPYYANCQEVCAVLKTVFMKLADVREMLKKDVYAAYTGDPACSSFTEVIRCYPGFHAIVVQRVAHEFYLAKAPCYPRELTELAHRSTGVDIHPGATIGSFFFIDHATGTVIGETAVIGDWVRIYQNVTIGALHFLQSPDGSLTKGYKRHPTIGSHVVIGTGAKILGAITIGDNVGIGANSWVAEDIPDNTIVYIYEHPQQTSKQKRPPVPPPDPNDVFKIMEQRRSCDNCSCPLSRSGLGIKSKLANKDCSIVTSTTTTHSESK